MLNRKGQGLTEYGIILLLILGVGIGIWSSSGIENQDSSMLSTIHTKLQSIIDGVSNKVAQTFDLEDKLTQSNRGKPSYKTSLSFSMNGVKYDILYRYETSNNKKRKVYTIIRASGGNNNYSGTDGLMTSPDLTYTKGAISDASVQATYDNIGSRDYGSAGYTVDNAGNITTYFNLDGTTYQITQNASDYTKTMLSTFTGDTNASITAVVNGESQTTTVAQLADDRTKLIQGEITDSTVTNLKKY